MDTDPVCTTRKRGGGDRQVSFFFSLQQKGDFTLNSSLYHLMGSLKLCRKLKDTVLSARLCSADTRGRFHLGFSTLRCEGQQFKWPPMMTSLSVSNRASLRGKCFSSSSRRPRLGFTFCWIGGTTVRT